MGHVDHQRLTRLLGDPELAWVLDRVRRRLELGQPLDGTIALRTASASQRDAAARLFGRRPRQAGGVSISLAELDVLLRRSGVHRGGLAEAVIELTGPVITRADRIADNERAWANAFARIEAISADRPELAKWVGRVRARGVVKRLVGGSPAAGRELLDALAVVAAGLPSRGGESLGAFAARVTGRAHALDEGSPLGTLAVGAARALGGLDPPGTGESATEARRESWASVGVLCDELSSIVLTLGLPGDGSATGRVLDAAAGAGGRATGASAGSACRATSAGHAGAGAAEPVWLTLRQLVRAPPRWEQSGLDRVLVVENPSVIALAADTLDARRTPLVCTNGQPRAAAMVLLRSLADVKVRLLHHGDFDWGGLTIGNLLHRRLPVEPYQFDRDAYLRAVEAHPQAASLTGSSTEAQWDPALAEAMRTAGRRIEEELVANELLHDLA